MHVGIDSHVLAAVEGPGGTQRLRAHTEEHAMAAEIGDCCYIQATAGYPEAALSTSEAAGP